MPARDAAAAGEVIVHVFGRTDVGRTREHNEDSFLVADLTTDNASLQPDVRTHVAGPYGTLFMVADGLGGAAAGEIASDLAVQTVYEALRDGWTRSERPDAESFATALKAAAEMANTRIHAYAQEHPESRGLGTTATIAGLLGDTLYVAQVGDSRAYLIRQGVARQITKDQSLMQRLVEAGELTPDEAERSERRNIILQALGPEASVKIDLTFQQLRRGDTLVLCTDGLSGLVKKDEIAEVVGAEATLEGACRELIERANEYGGPDNITVVVVRFEGDGLSAAEPDDAVGHRVFRLVGSETPTDPHEGLGARVARDQDAARVVDDMRLDEPPADGAAVRALDAPERRRYPLGLLLVLVALIALAVILVTSLIRGHSQIVPGAGGRDTVTSRLDSRRGNATPRASLVL